MISDLIARGQSYISLPITLTPGTDLRETESVTSIVDVAQLPKSIGGDLVTIDEDGKEDERCCRGVKQPKVWAFVKQFEDENKSK